MTTKHTPGPLEQCTVLHATENHHGFNLVDGRGWRIGCIEPIDEDGAEGGSNARRLVACWNACEGVDTELLEQNPAPFSEMRSERDSLLDALQRLYKELPYINQINGGMQAKEAIAKATGESD